MHLVCPAGSLPALKAAVQQGADAIYVGFRDDTNARHFAGLNMDAKQLDKGLQLIREKGRQSQAVIGSLQVFGQRDVPGWLQTDQNAFRVTVVDVPVRSQIDTPVTEQMIVELYSK